MASPLTHATMGYALFRIARLHFRELTRWETVILLGVALGTAVFVDADAIPGLLQHDLAGHHNQASHSLLAAVAVGAGAALLAGLLTGGGWRRWLLLGIAGAMSHVMIDFLTIGRGVQLFWPLTDARFQSPLPLFYGLRWSEGVWSTSHLVTLANEIPIIAALLWLVLVQTKIARQGVQYIGEG